MKTPMQMFLRAWVWVGSIQASLFGLMGLASCVPSLGIHILFALLLIGFNYPGVAVERAWHPPTRGAGLFLPAAHPSPVLSALVILGVSSACWVAVLWIVQAVGNDSTARPRSTRRRRSL